MKLRLAILFAFAFVINLDAQIINTIAGNHASGYSGDGGPATSASIFNIDGIVVDKNGNVYISDANTHVIRKINTSGIISTFAGTGVAGFSGDGGPATSAKLNQPAGLEIDSLGYIYVADCNNNRIRKISPAGIISTVAGTGVSGFSGDGGPATAAKLKGPYDIAIDTSGNLYFSDYGNLIIRKIDPAGIISTYAGNTFWGNGYTGDGGPATSAQLNGPAEIDVDIAGNLYINDRGNYVVRKVDVNGIINTIIGVHAQGAAGDGGPAIAAYLNYVIGLEVDIKGNIYLSDAGNSTIRKVDTSGIIDKFAGTQGTQGYSGDGGLAQSAKLYWPAAITSNYNQDIFFSDNGNYVIREISDCFLAIPEICMVQVDSSSTNNIIYWDKSLYIADTFYVYRDTANYNYALIGVVPYDSLSMFVDTLRSLYAANGDPNASSWRYKISYSSTCGGKNVVSPLSPWHQTLFMINSSNSFMWTMYQIEGKPLPVPGLQNYLFERDDFGTGNYQQIQALSASSTLYTDAQYSTYQNSANWRVETKWNTACTPTFRSENYSIEGTVVKSRSNVKNNRNININDVLKTQAQVAIYPNPFNGVFDLEIIGLDNGKQNIIEIYDVLGEKIYTSKLFHPNSKHNLFDFAKGVYYCKILSNGAIISQSKIIKQ